MARAVEDDEGDEKEKEAIPGSSQYILDGLENERAKTVHEALNPPHEFVGGCRWITVKQARRRMNEALKPYQEKMDKIRVAFERYEGLMAEEIKTNIPKRDRSNTSEYFRLKQMITPLIVH